MANYDCRYRTNYFEVRDEQAYAKLFSLISEQAYDFTKVVDGTTYHAFGSDCGESLFFEDDGGDFVDATGFSLRMLPILAEGEVFVYLESGHEKLRYITGYALVAAAGCVKQISLEEEAIACAQQVMDPHRTLQLTY